MTSWGRACPALAGAVVAWLTAAAPAAQPAVSAPAPAAQAGKAASTAAVPLAAAFDAGSVQLHVWVVPGTGDGRTLRIGIRNVTDARLSVRIPKGASVLAVADPIGTLNLKAPKAVTLRIAPGATGGPVDVAQTGAQRAIDGSFTLYVQDGKPEFRGQVTTGTVSP